MFAEGPIYQSFRSMIISLDDVINQGVLYTYSILTNCGVIKVDTVDSCRCSLAHGIPVVSVMEILQCGFVALLKY